MGTVSPVSTNLPLLDNKLVRARDVFVGQGQGRSERPDRRKNYRTLAHITSPPE